MLRSGKYLFHLWAAIKDTQPGFQFHIIPFEDTYQNYQNIIKNFGKEIDVVAAIYPSNLWGQRCQALELARVPLCVAVSRSHPLAKKDCLELTDLFGENLMIVQKGSSNNIDIVREEMQKYPQIHMIDVPDYDISIFNQCESSGCLMLTAENWSDIHPLLVTLPVNWDFTIPYGLLYSLNPSPTVQQFIRQFHALMEAADYHYAAIK